MTCSFSLSLPPSLLLSLSVLEGVGLENFRSCGFIIIVFSSSVPSLCWNNSLRKLMSINSYLYQTFSLSMKIWWRKLKLIKVSFTKLPNPNWFWYNLSNPPNWNNCTVNPLIRLWVPPKVLVTMLQARTLSPFRLLLVSFINIVSFQCVFHGWNFSQHLHPQVSKYIAPFFWVSCTCPFHSRSKSPD